MGGTPRVSVVIPAYNASWCILDALESVQRQTLQDCEVIVVDDGSTDTTVQVVESLFGECQWSTARLIRQENKRLGGARNTGIRSAQADLVAFLDADDIWYPAKLERVLAVFAAAGPKVGLVCHDEAVMKGGKRLGVNHYGPDAHDMYDRLLFRGNCLSPSAVTVRRDLVLALGGFSEDPRFHSIEDYDLWLRLSTRTRFRFLREVLGEYRLFDKSLSSDLEYNLANTLAVLHDHFQAYHRSRGVSTLSRLRMRRRTGIVYRQFARMYLQRGQFRKASQHLRTAVAEWPWSVKTWALAALTTARVL